MSITEITELHALAAVERAIRHRTPGPSAAVPVWVIREHLALPARSAGARQLRARLAALDGAALARGKHHGAEVWALSAAGKRRLARARRKGELPVLPESPQHQAWRSAHALAQHRIEGFRLDVLGAIEHAQHLLDLPAPVALAPEASPAAGLSDEWFALAERLRFACRRLGSAVYCLWEWAEPEDAHADVDEHTSASDAAFDRKRSAQRRALRRGRRNTRLWDAEQELLFFAQAIRELREQREITQAELAGKAGISQRRLASIEAGKHDPDFELLCALADALSVTKAALIDHAHKLETDASPT